MIEQDLLYSKEETDALPSFQIGNWTYCLSKLSSFRNIKASRLSPEERKRAERELIKLVVNEDYSAAAELRDKLKR